MDWYEDKYYGEWERCDTDAHHIWVNYERNLYTFHNECEMFEGLYKTQDEAVEAENKYCKDFL